MNVYHLTYQKKSTAYTNKATNFLFISNSAMDDPSTLITTYSLSLNILDISF